MNHKLINTSILEGIANQIRRIKQTSNKYQPINFDEELEKVSSLDSHLMRQVSEIYSEAERVPEYSFYKGVIGGDSAENKDNTLTKITFTKLKSLGSYNFANYAALKEVNLPENYSGSVGYYSFTDCSELEVLDLKNTSDIAYGSIVRCPKLVAVILRKTDKVANLGSSGIFSNTPIANGEGYIYVPTTLLEKYKTATNWTTYADKIVPIEGSEFEEGGNSYDTEN